MFRRAFWFAVETISTVAAVMAIGFKGWLDAVYDTLCVMVAA